MKHAVVPGRTRAHAEAGFALVLALLALLLLAGIASAALAASVGQVRAATMAGKVLSARTGARAGLETLFRNRRGTPRSLVDGGAVVLDSGTFAPEGTWRVRELRLAQELHLFIGEGRIADGVIMREARVAWWMDPATRLRSHGAVVESVSLEMGTGAEIRTDSTVAHRAGMSECDEPAALSGLAAAPPAHAALPGPPEWGGGADGPPFADLRLGWFSNDMLADLADHALAGGSLGRATCDGCWLGLVHSRGDLLLTGRPSGVLAVDGNLRLVPGARWTGLVLVAGDMALEDESAVVGLVRAGGSVTLADGAVIDGSFCAAYHALGTAASLARPIPLPRRSWAGPVPPSAG